MSACFFRLLVFFSKNCLFMLDACRTYMAIYGNLKIQLELNKNFLKRASQKKAPWELWPHLGPITEALHIYHSGDAQTASISKFWSKTIFIFTFLWRGIKKKKRWTIAGLTVIYIKFKLFHKLHTQYYDITLEMLRQLQYLSFDINKMLQYNIYFHFFVTWPQVALWYLLLWQASACVVLQCFPHKLQVWPSKEGKWQDSMCSFILLMSFLAFPQMLQE